MTDPLQRLPHAGRMRWIREVVDSGERHIVCRSVIGQEHLVGEDPGRAPGLIAIELFAQAAAAFMADRSAKLGSTGPVSGALLGTRKLDVDVDGFELGDELLSEVHEKWSAGQLAQFDCVLKRGEQEVARGAINVATGGEEFAVSE
jgi:predicted hotdog family 3-hydroxylacyl-ACP dehydratase